MISWNFITDGRCHRQSVSVQSAPRSSLLSDYVPINCSIHAESSAVWGYLQTDWYVIA